MESREYSSRAASGRRTPRTRSARPRRSALRVCASRPPESGQVVEVKTCHAAGEPTWRETRRVRPRPPSAGLSLEKEECEPTLERPRRRPDDRASSV